MLRFLLIGSSVSLSGSLFQGTGEIGAGDGLTLVFMSAVLVVALALYAIRPKGWSGDWPARCVPLTSQGDRESEEQGRLAA